MPGPTYSYLLDETARHRGINRKLDFCLHKQHEFAEVAATVHWDAEGIWDPDVASYAEKWDPKRNAPGMASMVAGMTCQGCTVSCPLVGEMDGLPQ